MKVGEGGRGGRLTRVGFLQRCGFEQAIAVEAGGAKPLNFRCCHHLKLPDCKKPTPVSKERQGRKDDISIRGCPSR